MGTGLSSGCRKLDTTPVSRAGAISQAAFSMNHAARRKQTGVGRAASDCSTKPSWLRRFGFVACAPMVERQTILGGSAARIAVVSAAMRARISGKPDAGSKFGGISTNTLSRSVKAAVSAAASLISAAMTWQPRDFHAAPFAASRTTARTLRPASKRVRATTPPTCPVIPVTACMFGRLEFGSALVRPGYELQWITVTARIRRFRAASAT